MNKQQKAFALSAGIARLNAQRDLANPGRWKYFAEETRSWWSVTEAALTELGALPDTQAAYEKWAEEDGDAVDLGPRG